ncbi:hypothetical protein [Clostridium sp. MD294]|uniref:hypothetical protein n=1 Tax=Clostridium sp. MD294 TaxID=97138 RepID=UPI0002CACD5B|nr:hypothetical protein [Clostridium sp. MD294]NDO45256.1 hypothetical protein [Clostridium sp. MD294]USF31107.1 hypothetical protein C820_002553 [Clostridium sp. MD294]
MVKNTLNKKSEKKNLKLHQLDIYKDIVQTGMNNLSNYDMQIIDDNAEYLEKLYKANQPAYDILFENMKNADSPEERADIRKTIIEIQRNSCSKDTENKEFYSKCQESHTDNIFQIFKCVSYVLTVVVREALIYKLLSKKGYI